MKLGKGGTGWAMLDFWPYDLQWERTRQVLHHFSENLFKDISLKESMHACALVESQAWGPRTNSHTPLQEVSTTAWRSLRTILIFQEHAHRSETFRIRFFRWGVGTQLHYSGKEGRSPSKRAGISSPLRVLMPWFNEEDSIHIQPCWCLG